MFWAAEGPPLMPGGYNPNLQIFQGEHEVLIRHEMMGDARIIRTDGSGHIDSRIRQYHGDSIGHWEGETLVVDTVGFNEKFWLTREGLPHTETLHLIEKFSRPEYNTLRYEVTVDDPRAYTRPWTGGWTLRWVANEDIEEFFCEENAESTFTR